MPELTDAAVRNAKPRAKPYKMGADRGMYLEVTPQGGKRWRFRYRFDGKGKLLSLGTYPDVTLGQARERREKLRRLLAEGIDPGAQRKAEKAARAQTLTNTFEAIAREWFGVVAPNWARGHADKVIHRLERDVFPYVGAQPASEVTAADLRETLLRISERGALETALRALNSCDRIFKYAKATGRAKHNPAPDILDALPHPKHDKHFAAVTDPKELGPLLRMIWGYERSPIVAGAMKLTPYVFVRPGELRMALWADVDLEAAEWRFTTGKTGTEHIVPLARQAVAILTELHPITASSRYVFPGARSYQHPMSNGAIAAAYRYLGIEKDVMSVHGWRATARTMLDEVLTFRQDFIEHQLAHAVRDPNGRAYNRTAFLTERRRMMQAWADYLDSLRTGADVIPIRGRRTA